MSRPENNPHEPGQIIVALIFISILTLPIIVITLGWGLILLFFGLIFGFICADMAKRRGRSYAGGLVGGYFFGVWSILYYLIVGDTTELRVIKEEKVRAKYRKQAKELFSFDILRTWFIGAYMTIYRISAPGGM